VILIPLPIEKCILACWFGAPEKYIWELKVKKFRQNANKEKPAYCRKLRSKHALFHSYVVLCWWW
jgi:hypothetical protein